MEKYSDCGNTLYFPLANEAGMKSSITPSLGGDAKLDQNTFLLQPVSAEDLRNSKSSRNFWVRFEDGRCWSATGESMQQRMYETYPENALSHVNCCRDEKTIEVDIAEHKLTVVSTMYGIKSEILNFVPASDDTLEIMHVTLTNIGKSSVSFNATGAIPMYCRSADNIRDHRHVTSLLHRIRTEQYSVEVKPTLSFDERGHKINHVLYYVAGCEEDKTRPDAFFPIVTEFTGSKGDFLCPQAILNGIKGCGSGAQIAGEEAMGGIHFRKRTLSSGESCSYTIIMGIADAGVNNDTASAMIDRYGTTENYKKALELTRKYWNEILNIKFHTGNASYDRYMRWVSYQPVLRRIFGCSFLPHHDYGRGGRGWRDLWQDCLALLLMKPEGVRENLLNNFGGVRIDGTNATIIGSRPGEFKADRNNIVRVWMDHGLWPLMTVDLYIEMTGDRKILLNDCPYFGDGEAVYGTVLEHMLIQNITAVCDQGEHGHSRLRGADWNDALDMADKRGESVAFTAAYAGNLDTLAKLITGIQSETIECNIIFCDFIDKLGNELKSGTENHSVLLSKYRNAASEGAACGKAPIKADKVIGILRRLSEEIKEHIRKSEWIEYDDMGWFNGYYDNNGEKLEGVKNTNVQMILTSQVFTIMSGTATEAQVDMIIKAADKWLLSEQTGGYRLNTDFRDEMSRYYSQNMGRMFGFAYGTKENGAVFSHMAVMYANALYKRNRVKEGFKVLNCLYRQCENREISQIYPGIPEYFDSNGRGMYHYLTGAASWMLLTVVSEMFGVHGKDGNILIEPKLLAEQFDDEGRAELELNFGGEPYLITYINKNKLDYGEYTVNTNISKDIKTGINKIEVAFELRNI